MTIFVRVLAWARAALLVATAYAWGHPGGDHAWLPTDLGGFPLAIVVPLAVCVALAGTWWATAAAMERPAIAAMCVPLDLTLAAVSLVGAVGAGRAEPALLALNLATGAAALLAIALLVAADRRRPLVHPSLVDVWTAMPARVGLWIASTIGCVLALFLGVWAMWSRELERIGGPYRPLGAFDFGAVWLVAATAGAWAGWLAVTVARASGRRAAVPRSGRARGVAALLAAAGIAAAAVAGTIARGDMDRTQARVAEATRACTERSTAGRSLTLEGTLTPAEQAAAFAEPRCVASAEAVQPWSGAFWLIYGVSMLAWGLAGSTTVEGVGSVTGSRQPAVSART